MKTNPSTDPGLRKALAALVQKQPHAPEGMTERFMARLAQDEALPKQAEGRRAPAAKPRPGLRVLRMAWLPAAAAAVLAIVVLWPKEKSVETGKPMAEAAATVPRKADNPDEPRPAPRTTAPQAETAGIRLKPQRLPASAKRTAKAEATAMPAAERQAETTMTETEVPVAPHIAEAPKPAETATQALLTEAAPAKPAAHFSARERELDQLASLSVDNHAALIVGERLATDRIRMNECLNALPAAFQSLNDEQPKAIKV